MKADARQEQRFIAEVDAFDALAHDVELIQRRLNDWLADLTADLDAHRLVPAGLSAASDLSRQAEAVNAMVQACGPSWARHWSGLEAARVLADAFDDQVILLVFGKLNAGKSSFCNFLAERFAAQGRVVRYFHLDAGRVVESPDPFKEGATETTARLQGVRLGDKMVLLDTPGLHSVTPENAVLTHRFTDSADGVLWLTSSASPGQVQELEQLSRELHRAKPLVPVVTRSDLYEEDEVDGALVKRLRNKSAWNRAQQEDDVAARAAEKLAAMAVDAAQLRPPVSLSVHMARADGQTGAALEEAGFERLYAALLAIVAPALAYKRRKPAETLLHHLEENVLGTLSDQVLPALAALKASLQQALDRLDRQQEQMAAAAWRRVIARLPDLLERHAAARDLTAVCFGAAQALTSELARAQQEHLGDYAPVPLEGHGEIDLGDDVRFDDLVMEADGAREIVGVDYARVYVALEKQIRVRLAQLTDVMMDRCRASLGALIAGVAGLEGGMRAHEETLRAMKLELRADPA